jgi:mannose-6-phosphate isomerase-like protein (cupin superfamily)
MAKQHPIYDIDPKTFYRPAPRLPPPLEVAMEIPKPLFSARSLADFDGEPTAYGKRSKKTNGRLETFTEVVNIGGSSALLSHPQLFKTIVVLEGYGVLRLDGPNGLEEIKLSPGDFKVLPAKTVYAISTEGGFMVLGVTQEAYYDLELVVAESVGERLGVAPLFGSHLPPRERYHSKAVEQSLEMATVENRRIESIETEAREAHTKDFDPFDPRWNGVNAPAYMGE